MYSYLRKVMFLYITNHKPEMYVLTDDQLKTGEIVGTMWHA
jgi:hypothetical protein